MIASVRTRAGLGLPPEKFYTNDSENTNRRLRHKTRGKELGETAFAKVMKELIEDDQETEFILGVFGGSGQYEFRESFKHLEISKEDWFGMSEAQRKKKVANIYALSIEDMYEPRDNQSQGRMFSARSSTVVHLPTKNDLSLPASSVQDQLDRHIAIHIWEKAGRLLSREDTILPAPSRDNSLKAFSVLSEFGDAPNFVQVSSNGKITCTCKNFKPNKICAHVVSVAEKQNSLNEFVKWYLKQKIPNNLTAVATLDVNVKASGRKPSAPRRRRQAKTDVQIYSSSLPPSSLSVSSTPHLPQIQITADQGPSCSVSLSSASLHPPIRPSLSVPTAPPVQHSGLTQSCRYPPPTYPYLNSLPIQTASVNPHVAVPPGFPLPPKPPIPPSHNPYFLTKLKGNIARCKGCEGFFRKDLPENTIDSVAVIGRKESDWYPFVYEDGSKCWRMSRVQNHYYHINLPCLKNRNHDFTISHLTSLLSRMEGGLIISNAMAQELWERFGETIFQ